MANKSYRMRARCRGEEGASLLEIAIVVLIMAVVIAFALPAIASSIRSYNVRSAAERIAERLAGARSLAMAKNKNVTVSFATGGGTSVTEYGYDFSPLKPDGVTPDPDGTPDASDSLDLTQSYYVETPPSGVTVTFSAGGTSLTNGKGVTYTSRGELRIGDSQADIRVSNSSANLTVSINLRGQVWIH